MTIDSMPDLIRLIFCLFASLATISALAVVFTKHPVRAALHLVVTFVATAFLWMLLQAEFLSLILIFVYVGAVMTLFLFVVMMFNRDRLPAGSRASLSVALIVGAMATFLVGFALWHGYALPEKVGFYAKLGQVSQAHAMGQVLYTRYALPFEAVAFVLLAAMVSAIHLAFRGPRKRLSQDVGAQVQVTKASRLRIITEEGKA